MTITLSDQELRRLMMLAYLGEWIANAVRKDPDPAYEDTLSKLFSNARETSVESDIVYDQTTDLWAPSERFEEEAHTLIDHYDDETFWEEITGRLTERDLIRQLGDRGVRSMHPDQRKRAARDIAKAYTKEFEEHGLERLFCKEHRKA